jgi:hypothetical protein
MSLLSCLFLYLVLLTFYYKPIRLCYIDFLFQLFIKESYLNVHMMDEKTMRSSQRE